MASSSQAEPFWQGLTSFVTSTKADEGEGESAKDVLLCSILTVHSRHLPAGLELDAAPLARLLQTYKVRGSPAVNRLDINLFCVCCPAGLVQ